MKVCILVHSNTGHTYSVAEKLKEKLATMGHSVNLEKLEPVGGENVNEINISKIHFDKKTDFTQYDAIIFGGPVRGFSISPIMKAYLSTVTTLKNKKTGLFVTQQFPFPWMGGNHTISQMKKLCETQGASVFDTGIINWSSKKREEKITDTVEKINSYFLDPKQW